MGYVRGNGSTPHQFEALVPTATPAEDNVIVASGRCTLDGVFTNKNNASADVTLDIKDASGATLRSIVFDPTNAASYRDGVDCGPFGMRSANGLQYDITTGADAVVHLTFLYRDGFA